MQENEENISKYGTIGIIGMGKNGVTRGNRAKFLWIPDDPDREDLVKQYFEENLKNLSKSIDRRIKV